MDLKESKNIEQDITSLLWSLILILESDLNISLCCCIDNSGCILIMLPQPIPLPGSLGSLRLLTEIANHPNTWQQLNVFKHVNMVKMTC